VVLLNNDTVPEPGFVETIVATWRGSGAAMISACLRRPDGSIDSAGIEVDRSLIAYDLLRGEPYDPERILAAQPLAPCAGAGAYERASFLDAGGFDEGFYAYLEDVDLGIRLRLAGHRCAPAPTFAWHEHSASFGSGSARKNRLMGDSRGYLLWKYAAAMSRRDRLRGLAIDGAVYAGQIVIDRNAGALLGRVSRARRQRTAAAPAAHPGFAGLPRADLPIRAALRRRLSRRRATRRAGGGRTPLCREA
jgi:GT2 family glycosyltransferase